MDRFRRSRSNPEEAWRTGDWNSLQRVSSQRNTPLFHPGCLFMERRKLDATRMFHILFLCLIYQHEIRGWKWHDFGSHHHHHHHSRSSKGKRNQFHYRGERNIIDSNWKPIGSNWLIVDWRIEDRTLDSINLFSLWTLWPRHFGPPV